jgi:hypothetical protein
MNSITAPSARLAFACTASVWRALQQTIPISAVANAESPHPGSIRLAEMNSASLIEPGWAQALISVNRQWACACAKTRRPHQSRWQLRPEELAAA